MTFDKIKWAWFFPGSHCMCVLDLFFFLAHTVYVFCALRMLLHASGDNRQSAEPYSARMRPLPSVRLQGSVKTGARSHRHHHRGHTWSRFSAFVLRQHSVELDFLNRAHSAEANYRIICIACNRYIREEMTPSKALLLEGTLIRRMNS